MFTSRSDAEASWEKFGKKRKVRLESIREKEDEVSVKVNVGGEIDFEIPKNDQRISMS